MNWQHLTYFKTTAEVQNFTRAAEQLYVTPSALSKAVHNLENELGFEIMERGAKGVRFTKEGLLFVQKGENYAKNKNMFQTGLCQTCFSACRLQLCGRC